VQVLDGGAVAGQAGGAELNRDIARFQAHLGRHDAIPRTLALLTTTLAEIDDQPSPETVSLCEFLQRPRANRPRDGRAAS
jgi:hypothetical protein